MSQTSPGHRVQPELLVGPPTRPSHSLPLLIKAPLVRHLLCQKDGTSLRSLSNLLTTNPLDLLSQMILTLEIPALPHRCPPGPHVPPGWQRHLLIDPPPETGNEVASGLGSLLRPGIKDGNLFEVYFDPGYTCMYEIYMPVNFRRDQARSGWWGRGLFGC